MSDWQEEAKERRLKLLSLLDACGLNIEARFVAFSLSRNANPKAKPSERSLNWRITLLQQHLDGKAKPILECDYSAGIGHCPCVKTKDRAIGSWRVPGYSLDEARAIEFETEKGKPYSANLNWAKPGSKLIVPDRLDVIHSLLSDGDAIEYRGFEDWAANFGYDTDSRKAEETYRACLDIGLKLRSALGDKVLAELREAFQDY